MSDKMFFNAYEEYCKTTYGIEIKSKKKTPPLDEILEKLNELSKTFFNNRPNRPVDITSIDKKLLNLTSSAKNSSDPLTELMKCENLIKPAMYRQLASRTDLTQETSAFLMDHYDWMLDNENSMTKTGLIKGGRKYNGLSKSMAGDRYAYYTYSCGFDCGNDSRFLEKHGIEVINGLPEGTTVEDAVNGEERVFVLNQAELDSLLANEYLTKEKWTIKYGLSKFGRLPAPLRARVWLEKTTTGGGMTEQGGPDSTITENYELSIYRPEKDKAVVVKSTSKAAAVFEAMTSATKMQYVDRIKGEHYYMDKNSPISNFYSIVVKNTSIGRETFSFEDALKLIKNSTGVSAKLHKSGYLQITLKNGSEMTVSPEYFFGKYGIDSGIICSEKEPEDWESAEYFMLYPDEDINDLDAIRKESSETRKQIKESFERCIRKSIERYAPVNTILWKVEFEN